MRLYNTACAPIFHTYIGTVQKRPYIINKREWNGCLLFLFCWTLELNCEHVTWRCVLFENLKLAFGYISLQSCFARVLNHQCIYFIFSLFARSSWNWVTSTFSRSGYKAKRPLPIPLVPLELYELLRSFFTIHSHQRFRIQSKFFTCLILILTTVVEANDSQLLFSRIRSSFKSALHLALTRN